MPQRNDAARIRLADPFPVPRKRLRHANQRQRVPLAVVEQTLAQLVAPRLGRFGMDRPGIRLLRPTAFLHFAEI